MNAIKESLGDFIAKNLRNYKSFDSEILLNSSCDDVDLDALDMFFNVLDYEPIEKIRDEKMMKHEKTRASSFLNVKNSKKLKKCSFFENILYKMSKYDIILDARKFG